MASRLRGIQIFDFGDIGIGAPGIQNRQIMSFGDLAGFKKDVAKFQANTLSAIDQVMQKVSKDLFNKIVLKTPYDTGRAKASWRMSLGDADPTVEPEGVEYSEQMAVTKSTAQGAALAQFIRAGDTIVISNNLPYIRHLEFGLYDGPTEKVTGEGYSKQAPQGMVRTTIDEFDYLVVDAVRETRI